MDEEFMGEEQRQPAKSIASQIKTTSTASSSPTSIVTGADLPADFADLSLPQLLYRAATQSDARLIHLTSSGQTQQTYAELWQAASTLCQDLQAQGLQPQDCVILHCRHSQPFLTGLWACLLGGFVPVPIAVPPHYDTDRSKTSLLTHTIATLYPPLILTDSTPHPSLSSLLSPFSPTPTLHPIPFSHPHPSLPPSPTPLPPSLSPTPLSLLLFTSGSTGTPKGVQISQRNLLASIHGMITANRLDRASVCLNWMPLEHVASIAMFHLTQVALGCTQIQVENGLILQNPLQWLDLVDRFRVTHTWAPNFAYGLIGDRAAEVEARSWDLSCLRWMGNGAEAVVGKTTRRFLALLSPKGLGDTVVSPGYGMSETCSGIVHSHEFSRQTSRDQDSFVEVGTPIPGVSLRIVDEQDQILPGGAIGRLQVQGATIMLGYYQRPDLDRQVFTADGWFDTGDLGCLQNGRLTITGRQKEVIVINGVNYYSHEIEAAVEELPDIQVAMTAACAVRRTTDETDRLAIFCVPSLRDQITDQITNQAAIARLVKAIRRQVVQAIGITPTYIIPVVPAAIPKTNLGKIQRSQLGQRFAAGEFDAIIGQVTAALSQVTDHPQNQRQQQIAAIWRSVLGLTAVGIHDNFFELGGTSLLLMQVLQQLQTSLDPNLSAIDLFQHPTIASLSQSLASAAQPVLRPTAPSPRSIDTAEVAVIGMACRFPGANSIEEFWQNLQAGVESIAQFSESELLASGIDPDLVRHPQYVKASPILSNIDQFDADFFGYSPKEACLLDPQQRLLLECAWECLEDAGCNPTQNTAAIGLYAGASMNTYLLNQVYPNRDRLDEQDSLQVLTLSSLGGFQLTTANDKDYLTTRVSYKLNLTGPSVNVQTACSTSLVAIHLARQSLLNGECEMALAGGVSVHVPQQVGHLYRDGMILTADGHCRAFDAQASGTIFGSGVGLVLLKRLDRALSDGDRIYAVIKGSAIGNDGSRKVGYFAPSARGQSTVTAAALQIANVEANTIGYVEAHGTGTILGDPIEIAGLTQAFRLSTPQTQFCAIGSVKTNVGHLNIASGIVGFIKTALCLHHQKIPPSLHFNTPNPQINFAQTPFYVNTQLTDWPSPPHPRRAGINSLGIGGTNVHVILEQAPATPIAPRPTDPRSHHLFTLSAKTPAALTDLAQRHLKFLADQLDSILPDLCFTSQTGRSPFTHRLSFVVQSRTDLQQQLTNWINQALPPSPCPPVPPPSPAWLFTGQGSHYAGMGQQLDQTCAVFRAAIDQCDQLLQPELGRSIREIWQQPELLAQTRLAQPALFAIEYGLAQLWLALGLEPSVMIGHSIGEYGAACLAGVFSLADALKLVVARGALMQALPSGKMVAVMASEAEVKSCLESGEESLSIAAVNGKQNTVVSGVAQDIASFLQRLEVEGISYQPLLVSHAFHSEMMRPILAEFAAIARTVTYQPPQRSIISTVTGQPIDAAIATPDYWVQQIIQPVRFAAALQSLAATGCEQLLECGAKPVLIGIAQRDGIGRRHFASLHPDRSDWQLILTTLGRLYAAGHAIQWPALHVGYAHQRLSLPHYPFQRQRYWLDRPVANPTSPTLSPSTDHPLLGQRISSPDTILFQQTIHDSVPDFLSDHVIDRQVWFPAAAYLEMLIAANRQINKAEFCTLQQVSFPQALHLTDRPVTLQLIYRKPDRQAQLYSRRDPDADDWQLHCSAVLADAPKPAAHSIDPTRRLALLQTRSAAQHYQQCQQQGLTYGPAFQAIQQIWFSDQEAIAQIQLPEDIQTQQPYYRIHPVLLDAALQALVALVPQNIAPAAINLPIAVEQLTVVRLPDAAAQFWSTVQLSRVTPAAITADIQLYDAAGQLLIALQGLTLQRSVIPNPVPQPFSRSIDAVPDHPPDWQNWLYEVAWQPQTEATQRTRPLVAGDAWLIFDDCTPFTQAIVDRLMSAQQICHLIYSKSDDSNHAQSHPAAFMHWIDPADPTAFTQLLIEAGQQTPLRGILYGWGLGAAADQPAIDYLAGALHLVQALATVIFPQPPQCWFVTAGAQAIDLPDRQDVPVVNPSQACLWGFVKTARLEHPELSLHYLDLDPADWQSGSSDRQQSALDLLLPQLQPIDPAAAIGLRQHQVYYPRLIPHAVLNNDTDQTSLQLICSQPGNLNTLQWQSSLRRSPAAHEVEIRVQASGLNFRDLLNALDQYPGEAGPLGLECAGEIVAVGAAVHQFQVGDPVVAIAPGSFRSFVTVDAALVVAKPAALSLTAAATLPTAYLTATYALRTLAQLKPGDRLLIHAAAGGVGQAAIQIAQQLGAEIFVTASLPKWDWLKSQGLTRIYPSRTLDFAAVIQAIGGVDCVLNCLTGEFIPHSLSVLRPGGCFLEIGKIGIWSAEQVAALRPDITYHPIDLMDLTQTQPDQIQALLQQLIAEVPHSLPPLPHQVFAAAQALDAFRTMQQAKQIGKLAIALDPPTAIRPEGCYLITGGTGGIGLQLARWLIDQGATDLLLIGRRDRATVEPILRSLVSDAELMSEQLSKRQKITIEYQQADVSDWTQIASLIPTDRPVRGIFHAAGSLDDGVLLQQTWDRFQTVMSAKVQGAWNLHRLTQTLGLDRQLDHFVLFSSAASLIGSAGQVNYATANAFLDGLAHYRRSIGLSGLSINWAAWQNTGMAARSLSGSPASATSGQLPPLPPDQALASLTYLLQRSRLAHPPAQIGLLPIDTRTLSAANFYADLSPITHSDPSNTPNTPDPIPLDRPQLLAHLSQQISRILGIPAAAIDPHQGLSDLGMDSLTAVELRNTLQTQFSCRLSATLLFDYPTLDRLAQHLLDQLASPAPAQQPNSTPDRAAIDQLTEAEAEALLLQALEEWGGVEG